MTDGPLFIVDNSPGGRSGLDYLRDWTELASRFDIATGFFDIGSLLALDGNWQKLEAIRILMGDEVAHSTRKALLDAVAQRAQEELDTSLESEKKTDPFLEGADAIVEALSNGTIQCRVATRDKRKFHAKAYITHARLEVVGAQALVGSSNFTRPGLTQNVELNIKLESSAEVAQLQQWYEEHWADAEEITPALLKTVERHTQPFSPFDVWARSLQVLVSSHPAAGAAWDESESKMYPKLDRYQQEAYAALVDIARQHGGAFLCDGVGLGKTYVGLMLIERLVLAEKKRVVLFAPKAVREGVWEKELKKHLTHIGGFGGSSDFSDLTVFSHTDLSRTDPFPERLERVAELADAVVIDEAHHFRNRGRRPVEDDPSTWSRYHRLFELVQNSSRPKQVFLLTATPINNSLNDFRHQVELFSGGDDSHFSQTLGIPNLTSRINSLTKAVRDELGVDEDPSDAPDVLQELLSGDAVFRGLVVQRSRKYAQESQKLEKGEATAFPTRLDPTVVEYSLREAHDDLLQLIDESFAKERPLFSLAIYYPLAFHLRRDEVDKKEDNRQRQVVGLIRTNFLKRFESSVFAFERSCQRLMYRLLAFLEANSDDDSDQAPHRRWVDQHRKLLVFVEKRQQDVLGVRDPEEDDDDNEDVVPPEMLDSFIALDPLEDYDIGKIRAECLLDLDQIAQILEHTRRYEPADDDKVNALMKLLQGPNLAGRKTLVFTEFADTARFVRKRVEAELEGVFSVDGSSGVDRGDIVERFSPYYNGTSSAFLADQGRKEITVLISTDVLAEGLNLQDATRLINYDIHWNPVKLMQRIGRVDRRLNPEVEQALCEAHPELAADRGQIEIYNFLPPDDLDALLKLYERVSMKTLMISKTLGIEAPFLRPDDDYEALKEFNGKYEGSTSAHEKLQLEYQQLLAANPGLDERLAAFPSGVYSGKSSDGPATFLCYELPALDAEAGAFTLAAGVTRWYLRRGNADPIEDLGEIATAIRCDPQTQRSVPGNRGVPLEAKKGVEDFIHNTYMRDLNVPIDAPKPRLVAWMSLE